jgi:bisphosphoglycerate-dependent phosphoglycerate mutase
MSDKQVVKSSSELEPTRAEGFKRVVAKVLSFFTGDILTTSKMQKLYKYMWIVAGIYFASILAILVSLQLDINCATLQREVVFLEERDIRTSEECSDHASHSAILRKVKERGLNYYDPKGVPTTIK